MIKSLAAIALAVQLAGPCSKKPPTPPPPPQIRVDTVIVTREVAPPLPEGTPARVCLSTGYPMPILISASGDTLVGERRVRVQDVRPGLVFEGSYAAGKPWIDKGQFTFERRTYTKFGTRNALDCDMLKQIGEYDGIPLFADVGAKSPVETIQVPLGPGVWQAFRNRR